MRIQLHIIKRQIGSKQRSVSGLSGIQVNRQQDLILPDYLGRLLLGSGSATAAMTDHLNRIIKNIRFFRMNIDTGPADGGHDPSPVDILAEKGGFHQRRTGHDPGHLSRFFRRTGASYMNFDQLANYRSKAEEVALAE